MEQPAEVRPMLDALLAAADRYVAVDELARVLHLTPSEMNAALDNYEDELMSSSEGRQLRRKGAMVRVEVKAQYVALVADLLPEHRPKPITDQANEVLAVIALTQPVTVQKVSEIRGKDSAAVIDNLAERGLLVRLKRRAENRAALWKVSRRFLNMHNLNQIEELFDEATYRRVFPKLAA